MSKLPDPFPHQAQPSVRGPTPPRHFAAGLYLSAILLFTITWTNFSFRQWVQDAAASKLSEHGVTLGQQDVPSTSRDGFSWEDIIPSTSLKYIGCFSDFQCARLIVPLNWNATADEQQGGPYAVVAIIKLPSKVPVTDSRYGGPIILNPGGPGESGVFQVLTDGRNVQAILDHPPSSGDGSDEATDGKYFDILSFDPRGVNNTTPSLRCFADAPDQRNWLSSLVDYGLLWHSESIIGMEWARAEAHGTSCSYGEDQSGILRHSNTAQTVEDMVEIIEQEGQWRAEEARRLLDTAGHDNVDKRDEVLARTAYFPGEEKLQYWGMSYGTVIGSTFAALHPDRLGRLVIDGVVDPADHYAGNWLTQMQDADHIVTKLCEYCFLSGPDTCPLYSESPEAIEARFTAILHHLKEAPIAMAPVSSGGNHFGPALITYGDAHLRLLSAMYFPFAVAEDLFGLLVAIESRDKSSPTLKALVTLKQEYITHSDCPLGGSRRNCSIPYVSGVGAFQAISCMDMGGPSGLTRDEFKGYIAIAQDQSQWIGLSWSRNKLACLGYTGPPAWRPSWKFEKQEWANTSHPLLIIGNTHDTVTPLRNARRVSTLFPGSVVLQQDSQGHCSHSTPSICTARTIREYFQTGRLPQEGTVCKPDFRPFLGCISDGGKGSGGQCDFSDTEEKRLWEALVELADPFGLRPKKSGQN